MPDLELVLTKEELKFRIVGGHHRFDAAAYLGLEEVPVTVIMDDAFDEDQERFQLVRMNMIRGKLDPQAFFDLYNSLAPAYSDEVLQDAFGFADEAEFRKLIDQTAKALPDKNLQKKFKEAAEEIKTIDGLSKLLNEMFTKLRRHAAVRLHGVRPWRPTLDVAQDRGQDDERSRPVGYALHRPGPHRRRRHRRHPAAGGHGGTLSVRIEGPGWKSMSPASRRSASRRSTVPRTTPACT